MGPGSQDRAERRRGLLFGLGAFGCWGLLPLYLKALAAAPAVEILCHRVLWAQAFLLVVVWRSDGQDGSGRGVFGQRYASSGAPQGAEFRVNTFTTSEQRYPSVSADASVSFVVAWQSYTQDGSSDGIFGQRYGEVIPVELIQLSVE